MKSSQMKEIADTLISSIRRYVAETRETLLSRILAGEYVMHDLHTEITTLQERLAALEEKSAHLRRVA